MIWTFQVLLRLPAWTSPEVLPVQAETAVEAEARVRALFPGEHGLIVNVGPAVSDLPRVGLDAQEQAYVLGVQPSLLTEYKAKGLLPRPKLGAVNLIPRAVLERFNVEQRLGLRWGEAA